MRLRSKANRSPMNFPPRGLSGQPAGIDDEHDQADRGDGTWPASNPFEQGRSRRPAGARIHDLDDGPDPDAQAFTVLEPGDTRVSPAVVAAFDLFAPLAEKLRSLRSLIFSADDMVANDPRIIVVAGVAGQDTPGMAANFAVVVSQLGYRGLLVDANFAAPTQHRLFGVATDEGVTTLLRDEGDARASVTPSATAIPNLDLLPVGPQADDAAELVERVELSARLRALRRGYCFIIIDGGSAAEGVATALSRGSSGVILVTERNRTTMRGVQAMIRRMAGQNVNVVGTVLAR